MKKICAMSGIIFNYQKPEQSIRQMQEAGLWEVMFDFQHFAALEWLFLDQKKEEPEANRVLGERYFNRVRKAFAAQGFFPSVARLPFINILTQITDPLLNDMVLRVAKDCIRVCEKIGCNEIIVQPLFVGIRQEEEEEWEANRNFFLTLASCCKREETRLLLTNQYRSRNGSLQRGICSDGRTAAQWIDALNRESDTERFGFCLDLGICNLCRQNMQSMILDLGKRIHAVILTENDSQHMANLLPFSGALGYRSTMDWLGVVRGLRETGFDGSLILETTDTTKALSPLLQPVLFPVYKAILDYFAMQINIENDLKKYARIALFGAGNMCRNYMKCYGEKYPPLFTCDNNPKLWGTAFEGLEVKAPEALKDLPADCGVIICNMYYREIEAQLRGMGIKNIGYFSDEYMPSFYFDRLRRESDEEDEEAES